MTSHVDDLLRFIDDSPTPFHAVETATARLEAAGYSRLDERDAWSLEPGSKHFVVRGGSSIAAFEVGKKSPAEAGFRIVGAHTDSPNLRIKPKPDVYVEGTHQLAVEPYGGVLLYTWLDRDLSLAGRVQLRSKNGPPTSRLVRFEGPLLRVPSLAIHLFREIHTDGLKLNAQQHLVPIIGLDTEATLLDALAAHLNANPERKGAARLRADDILGYDLMTFDVQPSTVSGLAGEFIHAPRLDNLASSHAALTALIGSKKASVATRVVVLYDHEEVGSRSAQGASGPFLQDTLTRLANPLPGASGGEDLARAVAHSWMISADMAHAVHPNWADKHEPGHRPQLGLGPVLKTNVGQSYATDGEGAALFASLCAKVGITPQHFVVRSDLGCGSTIGPISAARIGLRTIDIGNPMLSMHSCREMAGTADVEPMIDLLGAFFD